MVRITVTGVLQQLIPPALLTYFFFAWRTATFEVSGYIRHELRRPILAAVYKAFPTLSIGYLLVLYLKLYFLPKDRSVPPRNPPRDIQLQRVIFECLSPEEAEVVRAAAQGDDATLLGADGLGDRASPVVNRCWKGRCQGRWKPARARHCSECGVCRAGFDHHCAIFANCLTAADLRTFLTLLLLTPLVVLLVSLPVLRPLAARGVRAYMLAGTDPVIAENWWDWPFSWIIAGGPVGRWVGGIVLGWRELDRADLAAGGARPIVLRVQVAGLALLGFILSLISLGLAATSFSLLPHGQLTIDRGRARSHQRARRAVAELQRAGKTVAPELQADLQRWSRKTWFFVPFPDDQSDHSSDSRSNGLPNSTTHRRHGVVLPTTDGEDPYDLGPEANRRLILGQSGWWWMLPHHAIRRGMPLSDMFNWPINPSMERRLRQEAGLQFAHLASSRSTR